MLRRIDIDNYKCFVNFSLSLEERTLLIGRNGTGKTSVLDAIFALRQLLVDGVKITDPDALPTTTLTQWQQRNLQRFGLHVLLGDDPFEYRLEVEHDRPARQARIQLERLSANGQPLYECKLGEVQLYWDDHSEGPSFSVDWGESNLGRVPSRPDNTRLTRFLDFMRKVTICGLHPSALVAESMHEATILRRDGANFADWYRHIHQQHSDLSFDLTARLREVIDGFRGINLEQIGQDARVLKVAMKEMHDRYSLAFNEISDGQRTLVVLYALVYLTQGQGHTLFLDEPENFISLREIQPWLMELVDAEIPQAIICSHHPELIDYFGVDGSILLHRESGFVRTCKPLADGDDGLKLSEIIARGWEID